MKPRRTIGRSAAEDAKIASGEAIGRKPKYVRGQSYKKDQMIENGDATEGKSQKGISETF
jgi:hypothetical protein